jgi:hypothetical protein
VDLSLDAIGAQRRAGARIGISSAVGPKTRPWYGMIIPGPNAFNDDSSATWSVTAFWWRRQKKRTFRNVKHWAGFPSKGIAYCLREAGARLADAEHVAALAPLRLEYWRPLSGLGPGCRSFFLAPTKHLVCGQ